MGGETAGQRTARAVTPRLGELCTRTRWHPLLLALAFHLATAAGAQEGAKVAARLSGVVFDSVAAAPLANATVQLVPVSERSNGRSQRTNAAGAFAFDSIDAGRYLLGFQHPRLDSLALSSPTLVVDVRNAGELRATLAIPSPRAIITRHCGPSDARDSVGVMLGYVRSARNGMGLEGATVQLQWTELVIGKDGIRRSVPTISFQTGAGGLLAMCSVPVGAPVLARAWSDADSSGFAELEVPTNGILQRDLFVGEARRIAARDSTDSVQVDSVVLRGDGRLRGDVRGSNGRAIAGARISFWGAALQATASAEGVFELQELPEGTYTVEARALGFLPRRQAVDILAGDVSRTTFTLDAVSTYLDTVKVKAQRVFTSRWLDEFELRRKTGFGQFLDEDAINKRNPAFMSDLLAATPGVVLTRGPSSGFRVLMHGTAGPGYCSPAIFLDGARVSNSEGDLDAIVNVFDLRAMEVYTHGARIPAQYLTQDGCGSIVIWTGGRRRSR